MSFDNERILNALHNRWLEPPEPKTVFYCDICGEAVKEGEVWLECENGDRIHEDCKEDWIKNNITFLRRVAGNG